MELLDSVDKEFNEYEKIYICSGLAIGLLDQMIRDITKRSRPCSRNRIIMARFIMVLCRLNNIIQHDKNHFNVALEEYKSNRRYIFDKFIHLIIDEHIPEVLESEVLEMFKVKISKLKLFKALLESESFITKPSESLKETTEVDQLESESLEMPDEDYFVYRMKLLFAMVQGGDERDNTREESILFVTKGDTTSGKNDGTIDETRGDRRINDEIPVSQLVKLHNLTDADPFKFPMDLLLKMKLRARSLSFDTIISESESYRDDLLKLITTVKSKEYLHSLLSPTKVYEDSKIALEVRKYIFEDLMSMKKILMGLISNTGASYHIREMLEPKYRFNDIDGRFDRNFAKIFIKSGAKSFYRCSGESAIFVHGEKEQEDFIAILRVECGKLSEKECTEIFRYTKEFNLGVKGNEESLKTLRSGDRTDDNLIMFHE